MIKQAFLSIVVWVLAQGSFAQLCKEIPEIARDEMLAHQRISGTNLSHSSDNFEVSYYRCEWNIDPAVRYIDGNVTAYFRLNQNANHISFDLTDDLAVDSIKLRGSKLNFTHFDNSLSINFSSLLMQGSLDSVSIYYRGVPANTGFGSFIQDFHNGVPVIWSLSEPYGSKDWWPCKNGLNDKADSIDIFITHPSIYKAASNGLLQQITENGSFTTTHWKHRYPIATYLICIAVTNYEIFENAVQLSSGVLPMQTFCYPESREVFEQNTPFVLNALKFFDDHFGPYPFAKEKYGQVQFGWGGGMEHQTSTFIVTPQEDLMAHELAHQWFGDKITCASWKDIWLNEGFATHLASMYIENQYPDSAVVNRKREVEAITALPGGSVFVDDTTNVSRIFSGRLSYTKGSHLLYMLRQIVGENVFATGIKKYLNDPKLAYGFATTKDLKRNLEEASGKDLTYFFDQWFYGQGYPSYKIQWSTAGNNFVKIKVSQTASHPSVTFFKLPLTLLFKKGTQQQLIVADNKFNGEIFYKEIGFVPDTVLVDPQSWLITANNITQKVEDVGVAENNIKIFPNPFTDKILISVGNYSSPQISVHLYTAEGKLILKNTRTISAYDTAEFLSGNLSRGVYIIKIFSGYELKSIQKIIKR